MEIRDYRNSDADEIADLFHGSVHALASDGYTSDELEAWAPTPPDYSHWRSRLEVKQPYVACRDGMIVGFIELEDDGHIDCFYTHGDFQRQGVGRALYAHMLREARRRGIRDFHVEASAIARPFFEKTGWRFVRENRIERRGQILTNFSMIIEPGESHE